MKQQEEMDVVKFMIGLYCHGKHKTPKGELCPECQELLEYVKFRRSKCPFGENKHFCANCTIHCYKPEMQEKIRNVMKYAGPRMLWYRPSGVVAHVKDTLACRKERKNKEKEKKKLAKQEAKAIENSKADDNNQCKGEENNAG